MDFLLQEKKESSAISWSYNGGFHREHFQRGVDAIIALVWKTLAGSTLCLVTLASLFLLFLLCLWAQTPEPAWRVVGMAKEAPDFTSSLNPPPRACPKDCTASSAPLPLSGPESQLLFLLSLWSELPLLLK